MLKKVRLSSNNEIMLLSHICDLYVPLSKTTNKIINIVLPYSQYHMCLENDIAYMVDGLNILADIEFEGELELFLDLLRGRIDPYKAYLEGDFYITGDRAFFFSISNLFNFNYNSMLIKEREPLKIIRGPFKLNREFSYLIYTSTALIIWLGWVFNFNNSISLGFTLGIIFLFSLYYHLTDKLNRFEIYLLLFLFVSVILFLLDSKHYIQYYYIYFIITFPLIYTGSLYSRIRNVLSQYNSNNINDREILNNEIILNQRRAIVIWTIIWGFLMISMYIYSNTEFSFLINDLILSVISILFGAMILFNIYTIHNMQSLE